MSAYPIYTMYTAPEKSRPVLAELNQTFGFIPNIAGAMAGSPTLIKTFLGLFQGVHSGTFTEAEIQVLLLTNAVTNAAAWPVAFHSALAIQQGVSEADVSAIRDGRVPSDRRFAALAGLSQALIGHRGKISQGEQAEFFAAGFSSDQLLEAIGVVAASTITNYVSIVSQPAVEPAFIDRLWQAPPASN